MALHDKVGKGLLGSIHSRAAADVMRLARTNPLLLSRSNGPLTRRLRTWASGLPLVRFLLLYGLIALAVAGVEAWSYLPVLLPPGWMASVPEDKSPEIGSYFLAAQIGMMAIISAAIGIVTFISQKADGAGPRSETRLYYFESFAYEALESSAGLTVVLIFQLFWPLQNFLHMVDLGGPHLGFKAFLTVMHGIWLGFNVVLFYRFLVVTLRFLEPKARERMRENYTANVVMPELWLSTLKREYLKRAAFAVTGTPDPEMSGSLQFRGTYFPRQTNTVAMTRHFDKEAELFDLWLTPLALAHKLWRRRSGPNRSETREDQIRLSFPLNFGRIVFGPFDIAVRDGGESLSSVERFLINTGFRFRYETRMAPEHPPLDAFVEGMADQCILHIGNGAVASFATAFDEMIGYHRFVLECQEVTGVGGSKFNMAELGGNRERLDLTLVRKYRRVFEAAARRLGDEPEFLEKMSYTALHLRPRRIDGLSRAVAVGSLELGIHQYLEMRVWQEGRCSAAVTAGGRFLSWTVPSDQGRYDQALRQFVGAWEYARSAFERGAAKAASLADAETWDRVCLEWAYYREWLDQTAYMFLSAAGHGDEVGLDWFCDVLSNPDRGFDDLGGATWRLDQLDLTPEIFEADWETASTRVRLHLGRAEFDPKLLPAAMVRKFRSEIALICAAISLRWYLKDAEPFKTARIAAANLIAQRRQPGEGGVLGSQSSPLQVYQVLFRLFQRLSVSPSEGGQSYYAYIDQMATSLRRTRSRRYVAGRVYVSSGERGVSSLDEYFLIMMASYRPAGGGGVLHQLSAFVANPLNCDYASLEDLRERFRRLGTVLRQMAPDFFGRGVYALSPAVDLLTTRAALEGDVDCAFELVDAECRRRLAEASIRGDAADVLSGLAEATLRDDFPAIPVFPDLEVIFSGDVGPPSGRWQLMRVSKERLTELGGARDLVEEFAHIPVLVKAHVENSLFWKFTANGFQDTLIRKGRAYSGFWRTVREIIPGLTGPYVLVVSRDLAEDLDMVRVEFDGYRPYDLDFVLEADPPYSDNFSYIGAINGIRTFIGPYEEGDAYLFPEKAVEQVAFAPQPSGRLVEFGFQARGETDLVIDASYSWHFSETGGDRFRIRNPRRMRRR